LTESQWFLLKLHYFEDEIAINTVCVFIAIIYYLHLSRRIYQPGIQLL
jgi:hypothetical protein